MNNVTFAQAHSPKEKHCLYLQKLNVKERGGSTDLHLSSFRTSKILLTR